MTNKSLSLLFILLCFLFISCEEEETVNDKLIGFETATETEDPLFDVSEKFLSLMKKGDRDSAIRMFYPKVIETTSEEIMNLIFTDGYAILNNSKYPGEARITSSRSYTTFESKDVAFNIYDYPFIYNDGKLRRVFYMRVMVSDDKQIIGYTYSENNIANEGIIEPENNEPHLEKLNLQTDNISWLRIWYESGFKDKNKFFGKNYYAISGKRDVFDKLNNQKQFEELFELINNAHADSTDFRYLRKDRLGNPEWIYLRFKFDNEEYSNLGEFEIYCYLDEDTSDPKEILSDYIIVKHTDKTRYLFLKKKNQALLKKLKQIADNKYIAKEDYANLKVPKKEENKTSSTIFEKKFSFNIPPIAILWCSVIFTVVCFILNFVFSFSGKKNIAKVFLILAICGVFLFAILIFLIVVSPYLRRF